MADITNLDQYRKERLVPEGQAIFEHNEQVDIHASDLPTQLELAKALAESVENFDRLSPNAASLEYTEYHQPSIGAAVVDAAAEMTVPTLELASSSPQDYVRGLGERLEILRNAA